MNLMLRYGKNLHFKTMNLMLRYGKTYTVKQ